MKHFLVVVLTLQLGTVFGQEALWNDLNEKVGALYQQGQYSEAVKSAEEALKIAEETFGDNHPKVALSLNNLAILHRTQNKYTEAESLYRRSLEIFEEAFGPEHPYVAIGLDNLAMLYSDQGKYAEAESLCQRSLAILKKLWAPIILIWLRI